LRELRTVGRHLTNVPNEKQQLRLWLEAVSSTAGKFSRVLVDSGYFGEASVTGCKRAAKAQRCSPP
jgi:hypothetical protein